MALPTLDATFASSADLPRKQMLARWLVEESGSGSIAQYYSLPERYLWAKIAVAAGGPKTEADYISLPTRYVWSDIYNAVAGLSGIHNDWSEKEALGHIAAAYRGDTANPANLATYIDWPWRYKVAAIIDGAAVPPVIPFSPLDISGLQLWLDGSDASTMYDATSGGSLVAANGAIARWEDKSGNGKHATQSVSNNRPIRKTNQQNGLNAVEFDGTNDFVEGSQVLSSQPCSVVAVCKFTDDTEIGCYFGQRTGFIPFIYRWASGSGKLRIYSGIDFDGLSTIALDQWKVLRNFVDGSNSKIFINNTLDLTGNSGSSTPAGNYVIANFNDSQFQGLVYGELLVYNKLLTEEESSQIETYLNDKWSVY